MRARPVARRLLASALVATLAGVALGAPPAPAAGPPTAWVPCSKVAGAVAAREAGLRGALRRDPTLVEDFGGATLRGVYKTPAVSLCSDFDGDGDTDRALLYECCTAASPAPVVVLRRVAGRWRIVFARLHDPVSDLAAAGTKLVTTLPKYRASDALCCPARLR